ncbi:prepilin-type N-terminal cleavage/methylation domain-containing protein [Cryobacterium sp. Hz7]|uniref:type IV pilus modification PilV family protein n=1 Tax=Cryobacterium sp. Hz7 TaxID=1259166 RepID=UPI001F543E4E|nr:prepilin-type N-terminal cleavage/methylation domain-containing protein [Cryobacterium sp. Hz7]
MLQISPGANPDRGDPGFGLIEVVISMFLLSLLTIAFLPLLITAMKTTVLSSTIASASQLVSQQLDAIRAVAPNCAEVGAFDDGSVATSGLSGGTVFQPHRLVGPCPGTYPGVVSVRAWVTKAGDVKVMAEATTLVYVKSATP